jgi:hypothetical protein
MIWSILIVTGILFHTFGLIFAVVYFGARTLEQRL